MVVEIHYLTDEFGEVLNFDGSEVPLDGPFHQILERLGGIALNVAASDCVVEYAGEHAPASAGYFQGSALFYLADHMQDALRWGCWQSDRYR